MAEFFVEGLSTDAIGERYGEQHLGAYFRSIARPLGSGS